MSTKLTVTCGLALAAALAAPAAAQASRPTSRPAGEDPSPVTSRGGLVFTGQDGWRQHEPTSRMRVVSYTLPAAEGDEDAELVVYYFGPDQGGSVEANLDRWYGQFEQPGGGSTKEAAEREEREVNGMTVHVVDVGGTYVAETRPGSGRRVNEPGHRMLAAVVVAPGGSHFVKLIGPEDTVERWAESFDAFLEAMQQEG